jgi:hypothetical protein
LGEGGPRAGVPPHREDGDHRHPWGRRSASRVEPPVAATARWC